MEFKGKFFDELTSREVYEIARARCAIFLLEQRIVCQDLDRADYGSLHCFLEDGGEVRAYLRAYRLDSGEVMIGRVLSAVHGVGLGRRLMAESLKKIKEEFDCDTVTLHAQKQAQGFYEKLGFKIASEEFLEQGIPHIEMRLSL